MKHVILGEGKTAIVCGREPKGGDGKGYLCFTGAESAPSVGDKGWLSQFDIVVKFKSIEAAKILLNELNTFVTKWDNENYLLNTEPKPENE